MFHHIGGLVVARVDVYRARLYSSSREAIARLPREDILSPLSLFWTLRCTLETVHLVFYKNFAKSKNSLKLALFT